MLTRIGQAPRKEQKVVGLDMHLTGTVMGYQNQTMSLTSNVCINRIDACRQGLIANTIHSRGTHDVANYELLESILERPLLPRAIISPVVIIGALSFDKP